MRTLLLIPDGVGVRNFLLGPFPRHASALGEVIALHGIPEALEGVYRDQLHGAVQWRRLQDFRTTAVSHVLRKTLSYAQVCWVDTHAMQYQRNVPLRGSWRARATAGAARLGGKALASRRGIRALDRWHCAVVARQPEVHYYRLLFSHLRPSVLFCSHQRPLSVLPPVLAARSLGIPTATFIFSWDNLTSKGRIAAPFDHFLVWSRRMRDELLRYYPDVAPDRVHIVGTPQFDPYADPALVWTREECFRRFGADPARPLIFYSTNDASVGPEDPEHLAALLDLIRAGRIRGSPQVILRPHPADVRATAASSAGAAPTAAWARANAGRFAALLRQYPELLYAPPAWVHTDQGNWAGSLPLPQDTAMLSNLLRHSDLNINFASTVTIDAAIFDRPIVNIAYDIAKRPPFGKPLWDFAYQFEHYRPVVELGAARFARSREELVEHVNAYLADPSLDAAGRRRLVELQVGAPLGESSRRIVSVLERLAR